LSSVIGSFLISGFYEAALERKEYSFFPVYLDEFQSFSQHAILQMLSGIRKQGVSLTLAHHYTQEVSPELRAAIFGNVGTVIAFTIGALDAELVSQLFEHVKPDDLIKLRRYRAYAAVDGVTTELYMSDLPQKRYPSAPAAI